MFFEKMFKNAWIIPILCHTDLSSKRYDNCNLFLIIIRLENVQKRVRNTVSLDNNKFILRDGVAERTKASIVTHTGAGSNLCSRMVFFFEQVTVSRDKCRHPPPGLVIAIDDLKYFIYHDISIEHTTKNRYAFNSRLYMAWSIGKLVNTQDK